MTAGSTIQTLDFLLNGRAVSVENVGVQATALDVLRDHGLTGAKERLCRGECGACAILLVANNGDGSKYCAVNSCLMFAPSLAGQEVYTVESLAANGEMCEAQRAMAAGGGSQCGYCTPRLRHEPVRGTVPPRPHEVPAILTRWEAIYAAVPAIAPSATRRFRWVPHPKERLRIACLFLLRGFGRSRSAQEGRVLSAPQPSINAWRLPARILRFGGSRAIPTSAWRSNLRFRRWPHLASLEAVPELQEFSERPDRVRIGAALPLSEIESRWSNSPELVRQWLPLFASPTIRNRATLGGNLATASPIGDGAPMLLALDASD